MIIEINVAGGPGPSRAIPPVRSSPGRRGLGTCIGTAHGSIGLRWQRSLHNLGRCILSLLIPTYDLTEDSNVLTFHSLKPKQPAGSTVVIVPPIMLVLPTATGRPVIGIVNWNSLSFAKRGTPGGASPSAFFRGWAFRIPPFPRGEPCIAKHRTLGKSNHKES